MGESERERLDRLAAELAADDPTWAQQFSSSPSGRSRRRRPLIVGTGLLCAALVVLAVATSTVAVGLLAVPIAATAATVTVARTLYADWSAAGGGKAGDS